MDARCTRVWRCPIDEESERKLFPAQRNPHYSRRLEAMHLDCHRNAILDQSECAVAARTLTPTGHIRYSRVLRGGQAEAGMLQHTSMPMKTAATPIDVRHKSHYTILCKTM
jgi:hypothetical protein